MYPLRVGESKVFTLEDVNDEGEAVPYTGNAPSWNTNASTVISITPTADPLKVTVKAIGTIGQTAEVRFQDASGESTVEEIQIIGHAVGRGFDLS